MLIWLNGPFGGGKTQTAYELHRRLPRSVVCDPEHVGFGLHRTLPPALRGDFQDLAAWRAGVVEVLDLALRKQGGTVLVPMTVVDARYFDETVGRLRVMGHDVRHFALLAEREIVLHRLRERALGHVVGAALGRVQLRRESFAVRRLDDCLGRLRSPRFAEHVRTDSIGVSEVAEHIARMAGLDLLPDTDSAVRRRLRRAVVGLRHVRLG
jgi:hypothetical protein